jgi:hypothetical protein
MTYFCKLTSTVFIFPNVLSVNYDTYNIYGTGYGKTPSQAYKNAVVTSSNLYEKDLINYVISKKYAKIQNESSLVCTIVYLKERIDSPIPVSPKFVFTLLNSIKNVVVVRNLNSSTSQYTDTATSRTSCIFEAYYHALDSCNLDANKNISSLYITSTITSNE